MAELIIPGAAGPVMFDDEDVCGIRLFRWYVSTKGYVVTKLGAYSPFIWMHRFVLCKDSLPQGMVVDHINRNPLDNRKANLRIVSAGDNARNRSAIDQFTGLPRGVTERAGKYRARVMYDYKNHWLGTFDTIAEAVAAREEFMRSKDSCN